MQRRRSLFIVRAMPRLRARQLRVLITMVAAFAVAVAMLLPLSAPARAADDDGLGSTAAGSCGAVEDPGDGDMPALEGAEKTDIATFVLNMMIYLIQREKDKGADVKQYAADMHDCFPQFNVLVAQRKDADTIKLNGLLFNKKVDIDGSDFWLYVFKSGRYTKPGDLGYKNWGYQGPNVKREDVDDKGAHTAVFSEPTVTFNDDWYSTGHDDYDKTAKCSVNGINPAALWTDKNGALSFDPYFGDDSEYGGQMQKAVSAAQHCWPDHNVLITHDEGGGDFDTSDLKMSDGRAGYAKKIAIGEDKKGYHYDGYTLHVFDQGTVQVKGDGGWINWGYSGVVASGGTAKKVTFVKPAKPDYNKQYDWREWATDFSFQSDATDCVVDPDQPDSEGDDSYAQHLLGQFTKCDSGKNYLVTKHLTKMRFSKTKGLKELYSTTNGSATVRWDVFTLEAGTVVNTGDGSYENWAAWGADGNPSTNSDGDLEMHFSAPSDQGGSSSELGSIPDYGSNPTTFTLNTGSKSVTATQPKDSVATYVFKDGQDPQVTLTSADGKDLKYAMDTYKVSSTGSPTKTITVNPGTTFQKVDGFGGAMTSSAASLIDGSSKKDEILSKLFTTGQDSAGLSIARSPMGASDLQAEDDNKVYTFEDTKGSFGVTPTSGARRQIEVLKAAKTKAGSDFKLLGTPWTAPAWAKKGGKLTGNECGTDANELDRSKVGDYADYFKRYVDAYDAQGLKPWMVSMQNEPENCKTAMPTTLLNADDEVALSKALKSKLPSDVGVLGWDHNWNDPDYVKTLTSKGKVDAIGYHCYDGTHYQTQTTATKSLMTECSGFTDSNSKVADNLGWEVANLLIGPMRNGSTGSVYWSLAQHADGSPSLSTDEACKTCRGLLTINKDGTYSANQDFYYYGQFGKFVRPGATRVQSNNDGDLSSVAFRDGDTTTVVVLNSGTHADGGKAGSSESDYRGKIVQWDNKGDGQNPSWMVGADGYRRWISDISTYQCLHDDGGIPDAGTQPGGVLDKYINLKDVWAVCGASVMGTNSELEKGTYLKTKNGAKLSLARDGTLSSTDSSGKKRWSASSKGDRLILQSDGNLVLYQGDSAVWSTKTDGKGGKWLSIRDDGSFIVSTKDDKTIWTSAVDASSYKGSIVQWDGDTASQKTSWQVGYDGQRRVVPNWDTFKCLHDAGEGDSQSVSSDTLDQLKDLNGVQATCGVDRLGEQGELLPGTYLKAGDYKLTLQSNGDMVLWKGSSNAVWSTKTNNGEKHYLELQSDGNLVLYTTDHKAVWSTGTKGKSAGWLVLGDDGSLRLYDGGGKQVWTR